MPAEERCPKCGEEVVQESDFCPHCGTLRAGAGSARCSVHPDAAAVHVCIICHRTLCEQCCKGRAGRAFCDDHRKVEVVLDWANVFQSNDVTEAELLRSVLEAEGLTVQTQNFQSIGYIWDGGGDSPLSRSAVNRPAKIFVPIPEYLAASQVVLDWSSQAPAGGGADGPADDE